MAIEAHHTVFHFKTAKAHALPDHLHHAAVLLAYGHEKVVQPGRFAAPKLRLVDGKLEVLRFATALRRREYGFPIHQRRVQGCAFRTLTQQERRIQHQGCVGIRIVQQRLNPDVPHMRLGNTNQGNAAEQAGETEEILILQPAADVPAIHTAGELVLALSQIGCQFKLGGREGIGRKAHIMAIQPYGHAAFRPLKAHQHTLAAHGFGQEKIPDVAGHRVMLLRHVTEGHVLYTIPGVLHVDILGRAVALQLNVRGHGNIRPRMAVIVAAFKAGNDLILVAGAKELPQTVQRTIQAALSTQQLFHPGVDDVVGVRGKPVFRKVGRVLQTTVLKAHGISRAMGAASLLVMDDLSISGK